MRGALALLGDSEPGVQFEGLVRALLSGTGRRRPRVAIIPTAAARAAEPDYRRVCDQARTTLRDLGAEVELVSVLSRPDADDIRHAQAVGEADLIWFTAGRARDLLDVLHGSPVGAAVWLAVKRGVPVASCGPAAAALGERCLDIGVRVGLPVRWRAALDLAAGVAVVPGYDRRPEPIRALGALAAPRGLTVVGIDAGTALVGRGDTWQVHGTGRVTMWRGARRTRHRAGEVIRLAAGVADVVAAEAVPGVAEREVAGMAEREVAGMAEREVAERRPDD